MGKQPSRPRDINLLAKAMIEIASGQTTEDALPFDGSKADVSAMARLGGLRGGLARSESLSSERRSEIAKKAAKARWRKG